MRLIRNREKDGWLQGFGKLGFGRKVTKLRIRMDSSAVSFQLSYSSSLVAPDLTSSTFWLQQMLAALMSIGLKPSYREPTAIPAVLKSLTQAREQPSGKHRHAASRSAAALSGRRAAPASSVMNSGRLTTRSPRRREQQAAAAGRGQRAGSLEVDRQVELAWQLDRQVGGLFAPKGALHIPELKARPVPWPRLFAGSDP